ncbi:DNA-directed RNA polymerase IV and V subunit 11 [Raphidocelis subcapitata]|uniref:DNA-directed RNA polymerase IV and V subunit 11 n=1 Tax=Raphidocelis subcapitata TaxID=307507 RepID=A0A2V0NSW7_9CHLO|nr:DNA-directed RNA polymerase IV and V subunit 11 [Raphidocelis subcapitata]|eukprot:GBF88633.1 DNA-directed RNA polymerase IV and V subunit 11 [Raphidocelis subcapitata]
MNQPDRYERFVLPEHLKKLEFVPDTKLENAGTYTVEREDHTLGNLVRMQLHRDPAVLFSGYRIPHPLEPRMLIKVQTTGAGYPPQTAFLQALADLQAEVGELCTSMAAEIRRVEEEARAAAGAGTGGGFAGGGDAFGAGGMQY